MKRLIVFFSIVIIAITSMAQTPKDEVTLTVTGSGTTKEEAVNNALRSAIAQSYGVFVSANTQILNDSLVRDEIATVTSGNIKDYKEIAATDLGNGRKEVTLSATVSISKLINYANSKGASAEFAGAVFARNMKIRELNKANELVVMKNLLNYISISLPYCYDRKLEISEARMYHNNDDNKDYVAIPMEIKFIPNNTLREVANNVENIIKSISLSKEEKAEYDKLNIFSYSFVVLPANGYRDSTIYWLRNYYYEEEALKLDSVFDEYFYTFSIIDNNKIVSMFKAKREMPCTSWHEPEPLCIKSTGLFKNMANIVLNDIPKADVWENEGYEGLGFEVYWWRHLVCDKWGRVKDHYEEYHPSIRFDLLIPKEKIEQYSKFELIN